MNPLAAHLIPAIRWDAERGFGGEAERIARALTLGVGGFVIQNGPLDAVAALVRALHTRARHPLLIAVDGENGLGGTLSGATGFPPAQALAAEGEASVRRAAAITARDARTIGVNWLLAPVLDIALEPLNPVVGSRAFGDEAATVAEAGEAWIDAVQAESVLACAKHFPGHGRTLLDSHLDLPIIEAEQQLLHEIDLAPFRAAIDVGVASVMVGHIAVPAFDASGRAASMSAPIIQQLLREMMGFDGLVVSDALEMDGALALEAEPAAAVRALGAGLDLLLAPFDPAAILKAMERAIADGVLDAEQLERSRARRLQWAQWGTPAAPGRATTLDDAMWARQAAARALTVVRGQLPIITSRVRLVVVEDDRTAYAPTPSRRELPDAFTAMGIEVVPLLDPRTDYAPLVIAVYAGVVGGKGHIAPSDAACAAVTRAQEIARAGGRECVVVLFGDPVGAARLSGSEHMLLAWRGDAAMQLAVAHRLVTGS
ncbi:MAG: hypothetical protein K2X99_06435 [Gemmatimonadaceae bacterium]|nr:hypothetical protein [Gemmatimonadaceae bacterium]